MRNPLGPGVTRGQLSLRDEGMDCGSLASAHVHVHKDSCDTRWKRGFEEYWAGHRLGIKCHHAVTVCSFPFFLSIIQFNCCYGNQSLLGSLLTPQL